jgi:sterol desaturase/sphingolipid hydroxylase (fatty acid hydroxylase superfamily)
MEVGLLTVLLNAGVAVLFMLCEGLFPNCSYKTNWTWTLRVAILGSFGILLTLSLGSLIEINTEILRSYSLIFYRENWFTTHFSPCLQGLFGYYCVTLFVYWWHRLRHMNDNCWRIFHQIHHSTHKLQTLTAFYAHPLDFLSNALCVNFVAYVLLGLNLEGALWTSFWVGVFELWEHTNVKTPLWLGYFVVRPEMHRIHHEKHRHSKNYAIPLWDMLFGTYENSLRIVECGFERQNEEKLISMLFLKRVE